MTKTIVVQLALIAALTPAVSATLFAHESIAAPPATTATGWDAALTSESEATSSAEPAPAAAQLTGLCGMTQQEVAGIVAYYDLDPDMQGVAAALATPFDCSAYGQLCAALDPADAHAYACSTWNDLAAHASPMVVTSEAIGLLSSWSDPCTPDLDKCEAICDPRSVNHCDGIRVGLQCKQLALCDFYFDLGDVPMFEFLTP